MTFAVAVPLCGWFLAACISTSVSWSEENSVKRSPPSASSFSAGRRRGASRRRRNAQHSTLRPLGLSRNTLISCHPMSGHCTGSSFALGASGGGVTTTLGGLSFRSGVSLGGECCSLGLIARPEKGRRGVQCASSTGTTAAVSVAVSTDEVKEVSVKPVMGSSVTKRPTAVKQRRVVVTGMGVVSSLGLDPETFYANLLAGKSGISLIQGFDTDDFSTKIAGEIRGFTPDGFVHPKMAKRMDKYMWYLLTAGKKAVEHAGMEEAVRESFNKQRCGVLIGSALGGMQIFNDAVDALRVSHRRMNPFCIPFVTTNMGSAMLAMDLGWMGPNYSISTACATANVCIYSAANHIIRGEADVMLTGGSDAAVLPLGLAGFMACNSLSSRNEDPEKASRPWDKDGDGFVMGEGAGVLVLEELEHAKARGASIYAEFLGGSVTCDAHHPTEPHPTGEGLRMCMEKALQESGVQREEVNYVNAHAASSPGSDILEYRAIMASFGANPSLKLNATKSMVGHLLGASGGVEAIATVQAIHTGWLHPTLNLDNLDQELDPRVIVGGTKEQFEVKVALSNSFGFGGHNSSLVFAPLKPDRFADESD